VAASGCRTGFFQWAWPASFFQADGNSAMLVTASRHHLKALDLRHNQNTASCRFIGK
jgi:hypothetical protein